MTVLDANVLLYAYNSDAPQHAAAARWLSDLLDSSETIGLPWITIWAFLRISTNSRVWTTPLSLPAAFGIVKDWLAQPGVAVLNPGARHAELLETLAVQHGTLGALLTDTVLAALAVENGAVLASTDQGFRRYAGLRWNNPLSE